MYRTRESPQFLCGAVCFCAGFFTELLAKTILRGFVVYTANLVAKAPSRQDCSDAWHGGTRTATSVACLEG